jgi:hypothetical protein
MLRFFFVAAAMALGAAQAHAQETPAPKIPVTIPDELKPLAFMADACWEGPMPDGKQIVSHCARWFMRGRYFRERVELKGSNPPYGGESTYYWDHDAKAVKYIYWGNDGGYSTGTMKTNGATIIFDDERYIGKEGEMFVRAEVKPVDADHIGWKSEIKGKDGKWAPLMDTLLTRKPINWGPQ